MYKPGRVNQVPDALSRLPTSKDGEDPPQPIDDAIPMLVIPTMETPARSGKNRKKASSSAEETSEPFDEVDNIDFHYSDIRTARKTPGQEPLPKPVTYEELVSAQKEEPFCQEVLARMPKRKRRSAFFEDKNGILCRVSPIDGRK